MRSHGFLPFSVPFTFRSDDRVQHGVAVDLGTAMASKPDPATADSGMLNGTSPIAQSTSHQMPRSVPNGNLSVGSPFSQKSGSHVRFRSPSPAGRSPSPTELMPIPPQRPRGSSFSSPGEAMSYDTSPDSPIPYSTPETALGRFWQSNMPAVLVALSQLFGASQNLFARLLELEGDGMHPVQVLFFRFSVTAVLCSAYMWWSRTPDFPWGCKEIRWLLFLRGFSGFFGIFGMWYSMMYIPLADATVITFLAPGVAGLMCYFALREPFTRVEQVATAVALMGVVLIAQPTAFFDKHDGESPAPGDAPIGGGDFKLPGKDHHTTPQERIMAVGVALLGVMGAAGAFTTLRTIGKRAHPLISVNIFAAYSTLICVIVLTFAPVFNIAQPVLAWKMPQSAKQWVLLITLGTMGFVMQYLLTSGLSRDKSNKANAMIYTHMIFAAIYDRYVFHNIMDLASFLGCALILGSAICVIFLRKQPTPKQQKIQDTELQADNLTESQASPLMGDVDGTRDSPRAS